MQLKNESRILEALAFLPLGTFLLYPKFNYLIYSCNTAWQEPFYIGALLALVIITLQWYAKMFFDRLMLGADLFLIFGAFSFALNISPCLYILGAYKGVTFFGCILIIGLITSFGTRRGFINYYAESADVMRANLYLLGATLVSMAWSYVTNDYGIIISIIVPFMALRILIEYLQNNLKNTK